MPLDTHGRWPLVGALALVPLSRLAVRRPRFRPLAALLWHQTEEWVWPGGFLPWVNREVIGVAADEFPLTRRDGLVVNAFVGWGSSLIAARGPAAAAGPAAALYVSHLGNAAMHVSWAARNRRYDPGLVTAVAVLTPAALRGLRGLARDEAASRRSLAVGGLVGAAAAAAFLPAMRRRGRRGASTA